MSFPFVGNKLTSDHCKSPLTFFANRDVFVLAVIISLPVSQVAGIYCHRGFDLQLSHFHTVVKDPEELFRFFVFCQTAKKRTLETREENKEIVDLIICSIIITVPYFHVAYSQM